MGVASDFMTSIQHKKILLGVCGGIAAYKSLYLVRELVRLGAEVRVVMTSAATEFVTPMAFQALTTQAVRTELYDEQAERAMGHIELARWADYLLIAPLTANTMAKMAHGIADDLLTTLYLVATCPVLICPAMNHSMWHHPATRSNCDTLLARGVRLVEPDTGPQACGEFGLGRMAEVTEIVYAVAYAHLHAQLSGQTICITAGPTQEAIDPVRYLSNRSSGKMGYALARAAYMAGARVVLISGPTHLQPPSGVEVIKVVSAQEMLQAVQQQLTPGMVFIGAAAVADYQPQQVAAAKLKKAKHALTQLTLQPTVDILATVGASKLARYVVGFAAETEQLLPHARAKLTNKALDMIIANQVGPGMGFEQDSNQVTVITKMQQIELGLTTKMHLAAQLIAIIAENLQNDAS